MKKMIKTVLTAATAGCAIFLNTVQTYASEAQYNLMVIDDNEEVALAGGPAGGYNILLLIISFTLTMLVVAGAYYFLECAKYRRRFLMLYKHRTGEAPSDFGWNLGILKDQIREEEAVEAEKLLGF